MARCGVVVWWWCGLGVVARLRRLFPVVAQPEFSDAFAHNAFGRGLPNVFREHVRPTVAHAAEFEPVLFSGRRQAIPVDVVDGAAEFEHAGAVLFA